MPTARIRAVALLLLVPLLAACPDTRPKQRPAPGADTEWVRPFDGDLLEHDRLRTAIFHVVDARTGAPVAGAVVRRALEMYVGPDGWGPIASEKRTDEFGLVSFPIPWEDCYQGTPYDAHWTVHAPGYAAAHEYGGAPIDRIALEPARRVHGRIVDPLGRPLKGHRVGYKEGCGHAPWLATARTDGDGRFVLDSIDARGDVFYVAPGCLATYFGGPLRAVDETPWTEVAAPAERLRGRIVGWPLAELGRRMVWCTSNQRGAFAPLQDDGSFVLDGIERDGMLVLHDQPPSAPSEIQPAAWHPARPLVWDLSLGRRDPTESQTVAPRTLRVRLETADGTPPLFVNVYAVHVADGRIQDVAGTTDEAEAEALLELRVLPGTYELLAGGRVEPWIAEPVRVEVGRDDPAPVTLRLRANPAIRVAVPGYAGESEPQVAVEGAAGFADHEALAVGEVWAPADARVVASLHDGMTARFAEAGPVEGGVRTATIDWPRDRRLRFRSAIEPGVAEIGGVEHEVHRVADGYEIRTSADGRFHLRIRPSEDYRGDAVESFVERILLEGPRDVPLDLASLAWTPRTEGTFTLLGADGRPRVGEDVVVQVLPRLHATWRDGDSVRLETDAEGRVRSALLRDGAWVEYDLDHRTFRHPCDGPGPYVCRVGGCTLEVEVHGRWGILRKAWLMLDGRMETTVDVEDGVEDVARYHLDGLQPGTHTLLVTAPGHRGEARGLVLEPGETRRVRIELPERE